MADSSGHELMSWIDPDGVETMLNGEGHYLAMIGRQGAFAPPVALVTQDVPMQPGAREKYVQIGQNDLRVPVLVTATTESELAAARRALAAAMNPARGLGAIRNTAPDGSVRDLFCRLVDGLRGDESEASRGPGWLLAGLTFQAADPFWYDDQDTVQSFSAAAPLTFFAAPFLPLKLSSGLISTGFSVQNTGDVECWPIWTITGPGTNPTLTNSTTGETLALTITLTAGQILTIDTRPGKKTVVRENGSNQWGVVGSTSTLWALARGTNAIALSMTGTTSASQLQLAYKQRYLGV